MLKVNTDTTKKVSEKMITDIERLYGGTRENVERICLGLVGVEHFKSGKWESMNLEFMISTAIKYTQDETNGSFFSQLFKSFFENNSENNANLALSFINLVGLIVELDEKGDLEKFIDILQSSKEEEFYKKISSSFPILLEKFNKDKQNYHLAENPNYPNGDLDELKRLFVNTLFYNNIWEFENIRISNSQTVVYATSVTAKLLKLINMFPIYSNPNYWIQSSKI